MIDSISIPAAASTTTVGVMPAADEGRKRPHPPRRRPHRGLPAGMNFFYKPAHHKHEGDVDKHPGKGKHPGKDATHVLAFGWRKGHGVAGARAGASRMHIEDGSLKHVHDKLYNPKMPVQRRAMGSFMKTLAITKADWSSLPPNLDPKDFLSMPKMASFMEAAAPGTYVFLAPAKRSEGEDQAARGRYTLHTGLMKDAPAGVQQLFKSSRMLSKVMTPQKSDHKPPHSA